MPAIDRSLDAVAFVTEHFRDILRRRLSEIAGLALITLAFLAAVALATWSVQDPSLSHATQTPVRNLLGFPGAIFSDLAMQLLGLAAVMLLVPYFQIVSSVGLYNSYLALIITYVAFSIPFCTWMLWGYVDSIPKELDDAASIDGCNRFQVFRRVVMPLCVPGVVATAIYSFITGWNEYIYALALMQSEDKKTLPIGITVLAGNDRLDWNALMATAVIAVIPMAIIFVFFQRHLVSGLSAGAVKG